MVALPEVLKLDRIARTPKEVHLAIGYDDRFGLSAPDADPALVEDLLVLRRCITGGQRVPDRFYRRNMQSSDDTALEQFGLMHLHLGGSGSNVLVYLYQFPEQVFFLQISDHGPFADRPPGRSVHQRFWPGIQAWFAEAATSTAKLEEATKQAMADAKAAAAAKTAGLNRNIRASLGLRPKP